jgi:hypothetical protein
MFRYRTNHPDSNACKLPSKVIRLRGRRLRFASARSIEVGAAIVAVGICIATGIVGCGAPEQERGNISVETEEAGGPKVLFATEGSPEELRALLAKPEVIAELQEMHAGVAVGTAEMGSERAEIIQKLNEEGIPVTAWLTLPGEQGFYINASNAAATASLFASFERWSAEYQLHWAGVGLDIEPNIQEFASFRKGDRIGLAWMLFKRYFEFGRVRRARAEYAVLIRRMQADGYSVLTCQFPFLADDRKERTSILERLFGIVDVRGNVEALMVYTSFHPSLDSAMIRAYGSEAQAIVVGVTNGAAMPGFRPLDWDELSRDMLVASHYTRTIGVFNLEGCVAKGFLPRISKLNWNQAVTIPAAAAHEALVIRSRVQSVLWVVAHALYFVAAFLMAMACGTCWWRRHYKRKKELERSSQAGAPA